MALDPKWTATMDAAVKDARANAYDATIDAEIADYTKRFGATPGWTAPTRKIFKALLLVESGGPTNPAWTTQVAQIGANKLDPAYQTLKDGKEWSSFVMSDGLKSDLAAKAITDPFLNVRAAIAYAMTKAVAVKTQSVVDPADPALRHHLLRPHETFDRIRVLEHTTMDDIKLSNPSLNPKTLRVGQDIAFHRASMEPFVTGWTAITAAFLASRYNAGGDSTYAEKITYVMGKLP